MGGQHFDFDLDIVKGIYIPVLNFGFDLDWDIVTSLCYTNCQNLVSLSSVEAEKSYRTGGWVGGWWLAGWLGFEFRDSSSLGLS